MEEHPRTSRHTERWAAPAVLVFVAAGVTLTYWPGHMSSDTLVQIQQVRDGHFNDFHAPALLSLWHVLWQVVPGTWYVLAGCVAVFITASYVLLRPTFRPLTASLVGAAIALSPPLLGFLGVISRDTWFLALTLGAFAAVSVAIGQDGRWRVAALALSLAFAWLAVAARQNAVPIAFAVSFTALISVPIRSTRLGELSAWKRAFLLSVGLTAFLGGLHLVFVKLVVDPAPTHPEQAVFIYDTIQMSVREGKVLLPAEVYPTQDVDLLRRYTRVGSVNANFYPPVNIPFPMSGSQAEVLKNSWWRAVRAHPLTYLQTRLALGCEQIGLCARVHWVQHPFVDRNPWGYRPTFPVLERLANRYVAAFAVNRDLDGGMLFRVWVYLIVDVGGVLYLAHSDARRRVLGGLALATVLYEGTIVLASPENQYRFSLLAVATGLIIGLTAARDAIAAFHTRRDQVKEPGEFDRCALPIAEMSSPAQ